MQEGPAGPEKAAKQKEGDKALSPAAGGPAGGSEEHRLMPEDRDEFRFRASPSKKGESRRSPLAKPKGTRE